MASRERNLERYVAFHDFEGVDLTASPDEAGCIDMLNVESLERKGAVYTRPAWVNRGPGLDHPIVAFHHGQVQSGSDSADVTALLFPNPSSDWLPNGTYRPFNLVSNALTTDADVSYVYGNTYNDLRQDAEVYVTVTDLPLNGVVTLSLRSGEGLIYLMVVRGTSSSYTYNFAEYAGSSQFGPIPDFANGSKIGFRAIDRNWAVFHAPPGQPWVQVTSGTLSSGTPVTSGRPGVVSPGGIEGRETTPPTLDDFGTGPSTGGTFPENSVVDSFNRADEIPLGGDPSLVAFSRNTRTSATKTVAASTFLDAVRFSADSGSVILATENIKTATNVGINVIEADSSSPYVKITPMAYSTGPPAAPDLDWIRFLGVQQPDNRVVAAGVAKGANHEARVFFSNEGDHTVWSAEDYVDLDANDGEAFTGICNWRGQLWVFKETKAFVFYGNSVDQFGGPEFNYRTIDLGARVARRNLSGSFALGSGVMAGENGIYFAGRDGIYLVDGRDSAKVSGPVDALLLGGWGTVGGGSPISDALSAGLWYDEKRLYVNTGQRILVWDEHRRGWLIWLSPAGLPTPWIGGTAVDDLRPTLAVELHPDGNDLWGLARHTERNVTTDGSDPIPAHYRLGFSDFGSDYDDRIEETRVTGTGTIEVTVSKDFEQSGPSETLELTSPASVLGVPRLKRFKHGLSGALISTELSGDAPWAVHRIVHAVSSQKAAGTK